MRPSLRTERREHSTQAVKVWRGEARGAHRAGVPLGFALFEVLVAFVIAAAALGILFHAGLDGLGASRTASKYEQAVSRARSRLAMAVHADPLQAGEWHGDDGGGFTWTLSVAPVDTTTIRPVNTLTMRGSSVFPLTLYAVNVRISWRGGREVRLETCQISEGMR